MHRLAVRALCLVSLLLSGLLPAPAVRAQSDSRCFAETGFCLSGRIREFWEQNGGLMVFGLPIAAQAAEIVEGKTYQVQWFERNRMELHPESVPPYDVQLGRLGADRLTQQGRDWQSFPTSEPLPDCRYFPETKHNVCGVILAAWRASGLDLDGDPGTPNEAENLALFGLPLGELQTETMDGRSRQVQWFERARFELHPENAPPYDVLLGLLGNEIRAAPPPAPTPTPTPAPLPAGAEYDGTWVGVNTTDDLPFEFVINRGQLVLVRFGYHSNRPPSKACRFEVVLDFRQLPPPLPAVSGNGFRFVYQDSKLKLDGSGRFESTTVATGIVTFETLSPAGCRGQAGFLWSAKQRPVTLLPVDGAWEGMTARGERLAFTIKDRVVTTLEVTIQRQEECRMRVTVNQPVDGNLLRVAYSEQRWSIRLEGVFSSATKITGQGRVESSFGACRASMIPGTTIGWSATKQPTSP